MEFYRLAKDFIKNCLLLFVLKLPFLFDVSHLFNWENYTSVIHDLIDFYHISHPSFLHLKLKNPKLLSHSSLVLRHSRDFYDVVGTVFVLFATLYIYTQQIYQSLSFFAYTLSLLWFFCDTSHLAFVFSVSNSHQKTFSLSIHPHPFFYVIFHC